MKRMPRAMARVAREVTGIPTTPNMWVTPRWDRDFATRVLPSIDGGVAAESSAIPFLFDCSTCFSQFLIVLSLSYKGFRFVTIVI